MESGKRMLFARIGVVANFGSFSFVIFKYERGYHGSWISQKTSYNILFTGRRQRWDNENISIYRFQRGIFIHDKICPSS